MATRTLVVGATGFIGRFVAEASLAAGGATYVLVRQGSPPCAAKTKTIRALQDEGAVIVHGSINDKEFMVRTIVDLKIDVVISVVGGGSLLDQLILIEAIQECGTVKRFVPSEFGHDVDRADPVEPGLTMYNEKRKVRRAVEAAGIPFTYICCNSIAAWPYYDNTHPTDILPPLDSFQIYGDGTVKAYFVAGTDIGKFTMKAVYDDQTLNKTVHFRPPNNCLNMNELASLWEEKIGKSLPRLTISEQDLLTAAQENIIPDSIVAAFTCDIFINGCQMNFDMDGPKDVEICKLYPDHGFRSMSECLDDFILMLPKQAKEEKSGINGDNSNIQNNQKQEEMKSCVNDTNSAIRNNQQKEEIKSSINGTNSTIHEPLAIPAQCS